MAFIGNSYFLIVSVRQRGVVVQLTVREFDTESDTFSFEVMMKGFCLLKRRWDLSPARYIKVTS